MFLPTSRYGRTFSYCEGEAVGGTEVVAAAQAAQVRAMERGRETAHATLNGREENLATWVCATAHPRGALCATPCTAAGG